MLLWPLLTGTQLSTVAPRSWVLPSGHTLSNRHYRRTKPDSPTLTLGINSITPTIIETTSLYSSPVNPTTAFNTTTTTTISDRDSLQKCPQCNHTFTSRIGLVGHLRIHRTETGKPVPAAPTHSRDRRIHCPYCPRTFTHRMGLFGHMRIHDSGIHRNADNTDTSCTTCDPAILTPTAKPTSINDIPPASTDFICLHCARNFNSRISLVGHLRIHCTEASEPVPGAVTYSRRTHLHSLHCSRIFTHRMGLLGHKFLHDNLRKRDLNNLIVDLLSAWFPILRTAPLCSDIRVQNSLPDAPLQLHCPQLHQIRPTTLDVYCHSSGYSELTT
ncbi:unnamed protein product [Schistocephalus solidus]|uniref:C2H2-type domain-containing protein n=1 Tax=Schistocephalus solidus TaxID=70667 RepID=A0A183SZJ3_SCHSO|nr:unnamed protein product [Schistocephalus solidus]